MRQTPVRPLIGILSSDPMAIRLDTDSTSAGQRVRDVVVGIDS